MGQALAGLFGGAKAQGPSKAALDAQARQTKLITERETREKKELEGRERVAAARSGRGQGITLFKKTGERGVKETLGG